jgi:menaquinone-dependent protoporphyrinogen oxidase
MSRRLLVVYATKYGQTEKIARCIAAVAKREGIVCELAEIGDACTPEDFSDVVVAGSIYFGHHSRKLGRWVRRNAPTLAKRHTAFVTVCNEVAHAPVGTFLRDSGWTPDTTAVFAGAIRYTRYGWFFRLVTRRVAHVRGDAEYTDWQAVEAFARGFVADVKARAA